LLRALGIKQGYYTQGHYTGNNRTVTGGEKIFSIDTTEQPIRPLVRQCLTLRLRNGHTQSAMTRWYCSQNQNKQQRSQRLPCTVTYRTEHTEWYQ